MLKLKIHTPQDSTVSSAFDFAREVHNLGQKVPNGGTGALWFRGHAKKAWELKPSIGRPVEEGGLYDATKGSDDLYETESLVLQRFRRDGYPFVKRALNDWEAITLGQHHQLPTRLLDWTSNPLVALFFAAETHENTDGAIFAYRPRKVWSHHISTFEGQNPGNPSVPKPLKTNGIKIVFPMLIADRLIAQSGGFTIQDPLTCLMKRDNEDFTDDSLDILEIYQWTLPSSSKMQVLDELHRVSINYRTLFPGLDGVGAGLRLQERFRLDKGTL